MSGRLPWATQEFVCPDFTWEFQVTVFLPTTYVGRMPSSRFFINNFSYSRKGDWLRMTFQVMGHNVPDLSHRPRYNELCVLSLTPSEDRTLYYHLSKLCPLPHHSSWIWSSTNRPVQASCPLTLVADEEVVSGPPEPAELSSCLTQGAVSSHRHKSVAYRWALRTYVHFQHGHKKYKQIWVAVLHKSTYFYFTLNLRWYGFS